MTVTAQQAVYIANLGDETHRLGNILKELYELADIFTDRSYSTISDADLAEFGLTQNDVSSAINMIAELKSLFENQPVTQGDWGAILSVIRRLDI